MCFLVKSSWASSRTVWVMVTGGAAVTLQSTGGRRATLGRLHRHTAFTQLPYGDSYRAQLEDCRLTSWISEKNTKKKKRTRVSGEFLIKSVVVQTVLRTTECYHQEEEGKGLACGEKKHKTPKTWLVLTLKWKKVNLGLNRTGSAGGVCGSYLQVWTGHKPAWGHLSCTALTPQSCPG